MIRLVIRVEGTPVPKGSTKAFNHNKSGRTITWASNKDRLEPWERRIREAAELAMSKAGIKPTAIPKGPVAVRMVFRFARPGKHYLKRKSGRVLRPDAPYYHARYPDADKLQRAVFDALTQAKVWGDDGQGAKPSAIKRWCREGESAGVHIEIRELEGAYGLGE